MLAATAVALLTSERRSLKVMGYAVGAGAALVSAFTPGDSPPWVVVSLVALLVLAPPLLQDLRDAVELWPLKSGVLPDSCPPDLDAVAERELVRARRGERPLTVVSISVDGPPPAPGPLLRARSLARTGLLLARALRRTDVVGYAGGRRLVALLTETGASARDRVVRRLCRSLAAEVPGGLRVGYASFPDDNPTWTGLQEIARHRESQAVAPAPAEEPSAAQGLVGEEAIA